MNPEFFAGYGVSGQPVQFPCDGKCARYECICPTEDYSPSSAQAFKALDSLCQELEALKAANRELQAENARLQMERDTAKALGNRRGW